MRACVVICLAFISNLAMADAPMNTISFGGPVKVVWQDAIGSNQKEITDLATIKLFDGAIFSDTQDGKDIPIETSLYLLESAKTQVLYDQGVRGGTLEYKFDINTGKLWLWTHYTAPQKLNDIQMKDLLEFTEESWSDGVAASFSYELSEANDGTMPLSYPDSIHISQTL